MANELLLYEVNISTKTVVRHGRSQYNFPKEMREGEEVFLKWSEQLKTDSDVIGN